MPYVYYHVGSRRHVTGDASERRNGLFVKTVRRGLVFGARMTLQTDAVATCPQFEAVRIVAVRARYPLGKHLALAERTILVHLVPDLTIDMVEVPLDQRDKVGARQGSSRPPGFR